MPLTPEERLAAFEKHFASIVDDSHRVFSDSILAMSYAIHEDMIQAGFWDDLHKAEILLNEAGIDAMPYIVQSRIALIMSELGEAVEGNRKHAADDHLPQFDSLTVELADAIIRILDLAGHYSLPLGEALIAKCEYNMSRPHKHGKNS